MAIISFFAEFSASANFPITSTSPSAFSLLHIKCLNRESMNDNHARLSPALVETIAGLTAGIGSTLVAHPLDLIKTRLQIHRGTPNTPANSITVLRSLINTNRPVHALYRGFTPNLLGNASSWAIFFYFKSVIETQLRLFHNNRSPNARDGVRDDKPYSLHGGRELTPIDYFLASGASGLLTSAATNPIWVLKTRMLSSDAGSQGAYNSMWTGAKQLWVKEGWKGFYRGLGASCLGVSHGAVQFAVYEPLKRSWLRYVARDRRSEREDGTKGAKLGNEATLIISGSAKVVAGTATYPYQVVRSRLQTYDAEERFGKGIRGVVGKVWREEGSRGFYKGLGPNILRVMPVTWVTFLVYENVRYYLPMWTSSDASV